MILPQPPPLPVHQLNSQDEAHLKVISICHYVMAGFYLLGIGFIILHFMMMSFFFRMAEAEHNNTTAAPAPLIVENTSPAPTEGIPEIQVITPAPTVPPAVSPSAAFPKEIIPFFIFFYVVIGVILVALCVCNALSAHYIRKRKNRIFSFIIAGINCMQFPLGTALGVFTFIVLTRESVKMTYSANVQN
ncbi:MAG: hypothetical protein V4727_00840 [Verrucomicrobiota bacterium]